jgi:plastocyanin
MSRLIPSVLTFTSRSSATAQVGEPAPTQEAPLIVMDNQMAYVPATMTVAPGATITIRNDDVYPHTITATDFDAEGYPLFDSDVILGGETGTLVAPTTPGTYEYYCVVHGEVMHGTLVVTEPSPTESQPSR